MPVFSLHFDQLNIPALASLSLKNIRIYLMRVKAALICEPTSKYEDYGEKLY